MGGTRINHQRRAFNDRVKGPDTSDGQRGPSLRGSRRPSRKVLVEAERLAGELGEELPEFVTHNALAGWLKRARVRATMRRAGR